MTNPTSKGDDPRYTPGVSTNDDALTDSEWLGAMGPAPTDQTVIITSDKPLPVIPAYQIPPNPAAEAWATFKESTAKHELQILHDDGLYRHLRMSAPNSGGNWHWDVVTWPWQLATSGDIADGWTFSREENMIDFFALVVPHRKQNYYSDGAPSLDFRYWAEKLQGGQRNSARSYQHKKFLSYVQSNLTERLESGDNPDLTPAKVAELIDDASHVEEYYETAFEWLEDNDEWIYHDTEDDFKGFTFHFQLACYAINHAVQAYLTHQAAITSSTPKVP